MYIHPCFEFAYFQLDKIKTRAKVGKFKTRENKNLFFSICLLFIINTLHQDTIIYTPNIKGTNIIWQCCAFVIDHFYSVMVFMYER